MGENQSKSEYSRAQEFRAQQQNQGVSRAELDRLLLQQKKDYEAKLKQLEIQTTLAAKEKDRQEKERIMGQMMARQINEFNNQLNLSSPSGSATNVGQTSFISSGNPAGQQHSTQRTGLYPNLNHASNAYARNVPSNFVFADTLQTRHQASPSAPPASASELEPRSIPKRATSRNRSNRDEEDELNCRTCGNKYGLNIFQCRHGHSSCRDCKLRCNPCGVCGENITDTRNITLEAYISEKKMACPNATEGCQLHFKRVDIEFHLKECPFNEIACPVIPLGRCYWRGKISQVVAHFNDIHPEHRQGNVDTELRLINVLDTHHQVHLVDMGPFTFLVHCKVDEKSRKIYMLVQLLGTQISAQKWSYEVHVYNKREPRRKLQYSDVCHSNVVPVEDIFKDCDCVTIPSSYAVTYLNEGCLTYKFYIKNTSYDKEGPSTRGGGGVRRGGRGRGRGRGGKLESIQFTSGPLTFERVDL